MSHKENKLGSAQMDQREPRVVCVFFFLFSSLSTNESMVTKFFGAIASY